MEIHLTRAEAEAMDMDEYTRVVNSASRLVVDGTVVKSGEGSFRQVVGQDLGRWVDEGVGITPDSGRRYLAGRGATPSSHSVPNVPHWRTYFGLRGLGGSRYRMVVELDYSGDGEALEESFRARLRSIFAGLNPTVNGVPVSKDDGKGVAS